MKKLKLSFPFKWLVLALGIVLGLSIIIACVFGFNTSVEFGGGRRVTINITGSLETNKIKDETQKVLNNSGLTIENTYVEDNLGESYLVFITKQNNKVNYEEVKVKLSAATSIPTESISDFETINGTLNSHYLIMFGVSIAVICAILFVVGWIRFKLAGGLILALAGLANVLLHFGLIVLTRVPLSSNSLIAIVVSGLICLALTLVLLENVRSKINSKAYQDYSKKDLVSLSGNEMVLGDLVLIGFGAIFSFVLIFLPSNLIKFLSLTLLLGLVSACFIYLMFISLYPILIDIAEIRAKQKVSKNPNFTSSKKK